MSLLEDVFLEDEAGEAQELERVIEGDEYDDRPRAPIDSDDDTEKEDEAVEDKRRVDPAEGKTKRVVKNPRFVLNPARLTGPRGIQVIPEHFKDFKFKGKGHEREDLDLVLKKLEHWAYRLYPKFRFEDCLKKIETLGKKRPVMVHLHKIRSDQLLSEETVVQRDSSDDEAPPPPEEDEFDRLLQQQIDLARATPAPGSERKGFQTPSVVAKRSPLMMPKAISSPSISDEQKERMIRNRQLAEERRLSRLKTANSAPLSDKNTSLDTVAAETFVNDEANSTPYPNENTNMDVETTKDAELEITEKLIGRKHNRSNVIDSSDEDDSETENGNKVVTIDMHDNNVDSVKTLDKTANYEANSSLFPNKNTNVDIEMGVNEMPIARKHNRSNVFDSSDEESGTQNVQILDNNVEKSEAKSNAHTHALQANTDNIIDLVDSHKSLHKIKTNTDKEVVTIDLVDATVHKLNTFGKNIFIDVTEGATDKNVNNDIAIDLIGETEADSNHRSAVIGSSDDECDLISVNQNIAVDIHRKSTSGNKNKFEKTNSKRKDTLSLEEETLNEIDSNSIDEVNLENVEEMQSNGREALELNNEMIETAKKSITGEDSRIIGSINAVGETNDKNLNPAAIPEEKEVTAKKIQMKNDGIISKEIEDVNAIMDVDFNDDF